MRQPLSSRLHCRLRLPHPVLRRAPSGRTVVLRNPASRRHVRVRGNQVFGERLRATTGNTTSSDDEFSNDDFLPDIDNLFGNLNMGDNNQDPAAAADVGWFIYPSFSFQILLEFLVLLFGVDVIVLQFQNLNCDSALLGKPEGDLSPSHEEAYKKVDVMFKVALFSILADNIVDLYMTFDHGKDVWDALEDKFGVSDAGTELYVMEQYYDYKMTGERSFVEQAHEIQSLAKELEQFKCTLPNKIVAGGIIAKLPPSWRNFPTSLKHKRQEFSVSDLIGSLHVEEKARAKDTCAREFEGGSSANVVQKKNFQSHKFKNKNKSEGKGKFDGKNKASHSTNFKKKTDKKKGACHVCGEPDHWAPNCPNRYDKRGNGGKTANVVIAGDTQMKDVEYGIFPTVLSVCDSRDWWIDTGVNTHVGMFRCFHVFFLSCRKDLVRADGKRLTCFCSWCWYGKSEVYFGKDHPAEECATRSLHQ
ncbi:hypothetical protein QYE76_021644 [Lolium multiflorum]|uniref:CCHC-type domain-containing protein n=1 Tax=Lolium multiflorum TaxID=4521 RepID=A0AAD8VQD5_LOLMU|nr:hypothetical protein QYE76_021644 [Lolium multiflorum]